MMALEADRMRGLKIDEEAFITERDVVLQERKQRFETNPVTLFYENMNKMLWQEHPLANAVSGSADEIMNLSVDDANDFYNRYYYPNNALLVLSGDITIDEAKLLANKYYGKIKSGKAIDRVVLPRVREISSNVVSKIKGVNQPRFVSYYRIEAGELSKKEDLALSLLCEYLTGDDTAILYDKIVYKDKSLLGIGVSSSYDNRLGGKVGISAIPLDDKQSIEDIAKIIDDGIKEALVKLDEKELNKIKSSTLNDMIYMQENAESSANFVGGLLLSDYSVDEIENFDDLILSITVDDLLNVWNKVKVSKVKVNGYVGGVSDEI
jgi:zinc protease